MTELNAMESAFILGLTDDIAEEGLFSKIKDKFRKNKTNQKYQFNQVQITKPENNKNTETCDNISLEEFNRKYKPQFVAAKKEASKLLSELKKDPKAKIAIKWFSIPSENNCEYDYDDGMTFPIIGYSLYESSGIRRDLYDDPEWKASFDYIHNRIMKLSNTTKTPDLVVDVNGEYDAGSYNAVLKGIYCEDILYQNE